MSKTCAIPRRDLGKPCTSARVRMRHGSLPSNESGAGARPGPGAVRGGRDLKVRSRIPFWWLAAALLAAGCGDLSEPIGTVTVIQALTPTEGVVSVPREVTRFRFTGRGATGDVF